VLKQSLEDGMGVAKSAKLEVNEEERDDARLEWRGFASVARLQRCDEGSPYTVPLVFWLQNVHHKVKDQPTFTCAKRLPTGRVTLRFVQYCPTRTSKELGRYEKQLHNL